MYLHSSSLVKFRYHTLSREVNLLRVFVNMESKLSLLFLLRLGDDSSGYEFKVIWLVVYVNLYRGLRILGFGC